MALTKVSGQVVKTNTDLTVGVLTATTATFTTVSVAGTITYDDVTNVDSVGLITARSGVNITSGGLIVTGISTVSAGTTSAPSISPTGDTNTGIFFPSADTIAFGEGGAEAARFDSSGRLLVGTSSARTNLFNASASAQLQIEGTDGNNSAVLIARNSNDTAPPNFHLAKSRGTSVGSNTVVQNNDLIGRITFTGSDGTEFVDAAFIEASVDGTPGANDMPGRLVFSTTADGSSTPTERARITSAGLVGIGNSNPSRQLDVLVADNTTYAGNTDNANSLNLFNTSTTNETFSSIRLGSQGSGSAGLVTLYGVQTANAAGSGYFAIATRNAGTFAERFRITSAGFVGIGITSPAARLEVAGAGGAEFISINSTTSAGGYMAFRTNTVNMGFIGAGDQLGGGTSTDLCFRSQNNLTFCTGGSSERARIDNNGNLCIGATSFVNNPLLGVRGNTNLASSQAVIPSSSCGLVISSTSGGSVNNGGALWFDHGDLFSGIAGSRVSTGNWGTDLRFYTHPDSTTSQFTLPERMRIDSSGRLLVGTSSSVYSSSLLTVKGGVSTSVGDVNIASTVANITSGNDIGAIRITNANGYRGAQIIATADGNWTEGSSQPTYLAFSTTASGGVNPTERMRITAAGGCFSFSNSEGIRSHSTLSAGTADCLFQGFRNATGVGDGTRVFLVFSNGNAQNTNGSFTAISDLKLKENIIDANSQWNDLKAIKIRNWNFKEETGYETHRQIGPIAQELEQVCPGLVFETPERDADGNETGEVTKGVNQSVLYMKAVKALQEAMERIEQLEAEMAEVKAQLS